MSKKLGLVALLGCLGLTISGCKADSNDLSKQVDKMSEVIEKGKIFDKDYQIKGEFKFVNDGESEEIEYHLERDDDNIWVEMDYDIKGEDQTIRAWVGEKDDKYYAFLDTKDEKIYSEIDSENLTEEMNDFISDIDGLSSNLEDIYNSMYDSIENAVKMCKENNGKLGFSCEIEKTMFGTVEVEIEQKLIGSASSKFSFSIRGGKLREVEVVTISGDIAMEMSMEFSYMNQIVRLPKIDKFEKVD